jgi:hypothetical protein
MAKAHLHPTLDGISGRSGNMVFRHVRGQTIIAQRPDNPNRKPSAAQKKQRTRFLLAAAYAKNVLADPLQRRVYEAFAKERDRRADKLVAADFLNAPVVEHIELSRYGRKPGGQIRILATDDVEVVSLDVKIETADHVLVEEGPATKVHGVWCYTATSAPPAAATLSISVTAKDRPGNTGRLETLY